MADPKDVMQLDPTLFKDNLWLPVSDTDIPAGPGKESRRIVVTDIRPKIIDWDVTTNAIPTAAKNGDFLNVTVAGVFQNVAYTPEDGAQVIDKTNNILRPMKKSGKAVTGEWDVTPISNLVIGNVDSQYVTFVDGVLSTDWTGLAPGGLGCAILKTDIDIDALTVGTSLRLGFTANSQPAGGVNIMVVGLAPAADTAANIATKIQTMFAQQPVAAPFAIYYAGMTQDNPGAASLNVIENDSGTNTYYTNHSGAAAVNAENYAIGDHFMYLFNRQTVSGPTRDRLSIANAYIRISDNAYDLSDVEWVDNNPIIPAGLTVFYALISLDSGGGYTNLSLKPNFSSSPSSFIVNGTTFAQTGNDADWQARFPTNIASLESFDQATFGNGFQVGELYKATVSQNYGGATPAPYTIPVNNGQYLIIENVTSGQELFRKLTDSDFLDTAITGSNSLTTELITAASRRAGEMVFYIKNPDYIDADTFSGAAVYNDLEDAYNAAITYPKWIAKIFVFDDRAQYIINEVTGGRTYELAANNIWVATYRRWVTEPTRTVGGDGSVYWRARVDGLLMQHASIYLEPSNETNGAVLTLGLVTTPFGQLANVFAGNEVRLTLNDINGFGHTGGGEMYFGDNCELAVNFSLQTNQQHMWIYFGEHANVSIPGTNCGGNGYVHVYHTRNYANLNIVDLSAQNGKVVREYIDDLGFLDLIASITAASIGLGNVDNTSDANKPVSSATQTALNGKQDYSDYLSQIAAINPPDPNTILQYNGIWLARTTAQIKTSLALVKADVGLGNVDNTSDANKPISTATQNALNGKQDLNQNLTDIAAITTGMVDSDLIQYYGGAWVKRTVTQFKSDLALTKSDVGLANVDNTSDANKPISTATQSALDNKQDLDSDLTAIAALTPSNDDFLQRKAGVWTNRTPAQVKVDLNLFDVVVTTATAITITAAHDGKLLWVGGAGAVTITFPEDATENLGRVIVGFATQYTDTVTFVKEGTDVIIAKDNLVSLDGAGSAAVYIKIASGIHFLTGDLV